MSSLASPENSPDGNQNLIAADKDTAKYIQYLMEGTGSNINYEQIRDELNQHSRSINQSDIGTVSLINSDPGNSTNLEQFSKFLKVHLPLPRTRETQISQIFHKKHFILEPSRRFWILHSSVRTKEHHESTLGHNSSPAPVWPYKHEDQEIPNKGMNSS
jgi:hypothetical protein